MDIPYPLTMRSRAPQSADLCRQVEKMKLIIKCSGMVWLTFRNEMSMAPESPHKGQTGFELSFNPFLVLIILACYIVGKRQQSIQNKFKSL
jgi:hypothetical protein